MFHINNTGEAKSEWNMNETHIIIPMIDGDVMNKESDKILTTSLALNPLEAGDQAMMSNAMEHSFVIGLDKNIFETPNYKSDLVIIQNSDLKNAVAYTLSYIDQEKNEVLWQSTVQKNRTCLNDKEILEVRNELDYNDSVHELEKSEQITLAAVDSDIVSHASRTSDEILNEEITVDRKSEKTSFINYFTPEQNPETVADLQCLNTSNLIEHCRVTGAKKLDERNFHFKSPDKESVLRDEIDPTEKLLNITKSTIHCNNTKPVDLVQRVNLKTDEKEEMITYKSKTTNDKKLKGSELYKGVSDLFPEKSLPLKKKAKMKRTLISFRDENQKSLLKHGPGTSQKIHIKSPTGRKTRQHLKSTLLKDQDLNHSDCDTPSKKKIVKLKKMTKLKNKSKMFISDSAVNVNRLQNSQEEECIETKIFGFEENKFYSIYDLVEYLRKRRIINASIWKMLNSGLKEMKVDILKEMNEKKNKKFSVDKTNYSPQLKAFALVLYFKQPAAFNHLAQVFNAGWPSLTIIKEWKRRINRHQRQNFIRIKGNIERLKS